MKTIAKNKIAAIKRNTVWTSAKLVAITKSLDLRLRGTLFIHLHLDCTRPGSTASQIGDTGRKTFIVKNMVSKYIKSYRTNHCFFDYCLID